MKLAILMTCHNRRETTVRGLARLLPQLGAGDRVFLVDDGSDDGTGEEVTRRFGRSRIRLIRGDGTLFWAKGMRLAWETADAEGDWDGYLWLNDDVVLKSEAIVRAVGDLERMPGVVVGACAADERELVCTYGASDAQDRKIVPNGASPQVATGWFNGNFVLVPRAVAERVGRISGEYSHARADYDYAERLKRAGVRFCVTSQYVGTCRDDFAEKMSGLGLLARLKLLGRPGYWNLRDLWLIRRTYHGVWRAMASCAHLVLLAAKGGR